MPKPTQTLKHTHTQRVIEGMAQAMASMAGLRGTSHTVLEGSLQLSGGSVRLIGVANNGDRVTTTVARPAGLTVRATRQAPTELETTGRRAVLGLAAGGLASASFVRAVLAEAKPIKVGPPPAPSGGLPGTLNSDEARDLDKPLKDRFFIQPLPPVEAAARAKESAKDIVGVKELIDKKAWPFVQNDLRLKAGYLRYDLNTVISSKPRAQKLPLKDLTGKLFQTIDNLDYAAKIKSTPEAEKYYAETVSALKDVLSVLG